jgi:hypothetical protein
VHLFRGLVCHSSEFKAYTPKILAASESSQNNSRRIVVIGGGKSAQEYALSHSYIYTLTENPRALLHNWQIKEGKCLWYLKPQMHSWQTRPHCRASLERAGAYRSHVPTDYYSCVNQEQIYIHAFPSSWVTLQARVSITSLFVFCLISPPWRRFLHTTRVGGFIVRSTWAALTYGGVSNISMSSLRTNNPLLPI